MRNSITFSAITEQTIACRLLVTRRVPSEQAEDYFYFCALFGIWSHSVLWIPVLNTSCPVSRSHKLEGARAPWVVAFSFGLLHRFGFAGAIAAYWTLERIGSFWSA